MTRPLLPCETEDAVPADFQTIPWDDPTRAAAMRLIQLALQEDLAGGRDVTSASLIASQRNGMAQFVVREAGVVAGLPLLPLVAGELSAAIDVQLLEEDGARVEPGQVAAQMQGPAVELLTCERTMLNFLGRLSGVASLTRRFVDAIQGTPAQIYDTRKTTPGWRRLEKYAVSRGGGCNHRLGLHDAVLIKDNHLAHAQQQGISPGQAVRQARHAVGSDLVVEVEVDTLEQLQDVLPAGPDIVLLDNMTLAQLAAAVQQRDQAAPQVVLEASGGVRLDTVRGIAETGVDRISVGALTHSSGSLDIGLDWSAGGGLGG